MKIIVNEEQFRNIIGDEEMSDEILSPQNEYGPKEDENETDINEPSESEIEPNDEEVPSDNQRQIWTYEEIADEAKPYIEQAEAEFDRYYRAHTQTVENICKIIASKEAIALPYINDAAYGQVFQSCFGVNFFDSRPEPDFYGWELKTSTNNETSLFKQSYENLTNNSMIIPSISLEKKLRNNPSKAFMFTMNNLGEITYRFSDTLDRSFSDKEEKHIVYYPKLEVYNKNIYLLFYKKVGETLVPTPEFSMKIKVNSIADYAWRKLGSCVHAHSNVNKDEHTIRYTDIKILAARNRNVFKEQFIDILTQRAGLNQVGISLWAKLSFNPKTKTVKLNTRYKIANSVFDMLYNILYVQ